MGEYELYTPAAPVASREKCANYPALKIVSMVLAIISGLLFIYYAAGFTTDYMAQIKQYNEMGVEIPKSTINVIYFQLALTFAMGVLPIVGAILPAKFNKCAIMLTSLPVCWGLVTALPTFVIGLVQKAPLAELTEIIVMTAGGLFALVAAILLVCIPCCKKAEAESGYIDEYIEEDVTFEDYSSEACEEETEEVSEASEEVSEASEEPSGEEEEAAEDPFVQ